MGADSTGASVASSGVTSDGGSNSNDSDADGSGHSYDRDKVIDCMFDPVTSAMLAELEDGDKECGVLAEAASVPEQEVLERLSHLIEHGFVRTYHDGEGRCMVAANAEKLGSFMEDSKNFDGAVSGLETMDSYLN